MAFIILCCGESECFLPRPVNSGVRRFASIENKDCKCKVLIIMRPAERVFYNSRKLTSGARCAIPSINCKARQFGFTPNNK